jgi:hypothetical protein
MSFVDGTGDYAAEHLISPEGTLTMVASDERAARASFRRYARTYAAARSEDPDDAFDPQGPMELFLTDVHVKQKLDLERVLALPEAAGAVVKRDGNRVYMVTIMVPDASGMVLQHRVHEFRVTVKGCKTPRDAVESVRRMRYERAVWR